MGLRRCGHGHDICPLDQAEPAADFPPDTAVLDREADVIEAAHLLRDAWRDGQPTDELMINLVHRVDRLEELFAGD